MKNKSQIDQKLAAKWACSARTIHAWRKAGAPLNGSESEMIVWLSGQRSIPVGTGKLLQQQRKHSASSSARDTTELPKGFAENIARLEEATAEAHADYVISKASGDLVATKSKLQSWLALSDELRRSDDQIADARRVSGEMIRLDDVRRWATAFSAYIRLAVGATASVAFDFFHGQRPAPTAKELESIFLETWKAGAATAEAAPNPAPRWFLDCLIKNCPGAQANHADIVEVMKAAMGFRFEDVREFFAQEAGPWVGSSTARWEGGGSGS